MAGPCFHCGIDSTLLWRAGPPNKPVLCNDCGLWWKINGTLEDYSSKHVMNNAQSSQTNLFSGLNPTSFGLGSEITMSGQNNDAPIWDPINVSRKKRSTIEEHVATPSERLHQQLYPFMEKQLNKDEEDPENVLIFERINKYIPENEIGLGCMLLKPSPPSPTKDSKQT